MKTAFRTILIKTERDIVTARTACREVAKDLGFNLVDQTRITTAASELARNIFEYAGEGEVIIEKRENVYNQIGIEIRFIDNGPGIEDVEQAMGDGWTSHRGMGMGLPGAKKLMDEFDIKSVVGKGTSIKILKWLR